MKQIPNLFTLLNLVFGCLAIVSILKTGLTITTDENNQSIIELPEKIYLGSIYIGCAAVIDFFDGFLARLFKASSAMGKQLDSLADLVSFGVAPALIIYHFLLLSFAQQPDGLDISELWLLPAFIVPCAGAYRLARYNIDTPTQGFKGVPIPAAALLIASFPLIYWYADNTNVIQIFLNKWFWYFIIIVITYLLISKLPMLALKFGRGSFKQFIPFVIVMLVAIVVALIWGWLAVPAAFIAYVILSLLTKPRNHDL